jgi:hypothetical protein
MMNAPVKITPTIDEDDREYVLQLARIVSLRLREIHQEVIATGVALAQKRIDPRLALQMIEDFAPGCISAVHMSLVTKKVDAA